MPEPLKPDEIDELTKMLGPGGVPSAGSPAPAGPAGRAGPASALPVESFDAAAPAAPRKEAGMELLDDVEVNVRVELGRARVVVQDVLRLGAGSVVPLETLTGDPLDVYVNDRLVARGEILVVNDNFALRITELLPEPKGPEA